MKTYTKDNIKYPFINSFNTELFFTYYNYNSTNYIPGRVIFERIIDWDLNSIDNKKTLTSNKIIFNWYIESQKPTNFYAPSKNNNNSTLINTANYDSYKNCDIKYIYISFRSVNDTPSYYINPFIKSSADKPTGYSEIAIIKIDTSLIPTYQHITDLKSPDKGYGNGYLTMITGGDLSNTSFWITNKNDSNKTFEQKYKISNDNIDWKIKDWKHSIDDSKGYYFTIINNKSPLNQSYVSDNDGYYDLKITSPKSKDWKPMDINNINILDRDIWWISYGNYTKDTKFYFDIETQEGYDYVKGQNVSLPDQNIISSGSETKYGKFYYKELQWNFNNNKYATNPTGWSYDKESINITESANYDITCILSIRTTIKKNSKKNMYLFPNGQKIAKWARSGSDPKIAFEITGMSAQPYNLIPSTAVSQTSNFTYLTNSYHPTILDYKDGGSGLGTSGILYSIIIQKNINGTWNDVFSSDERNSSTRDDDRFISINKKTLNYLFTFRFEDKYLDSGKYRIMLRWRRSQLFLFGPESSSSKEWKWAVDDSGIPTASHPDTYGNYNFESKFIYNEDLQFYNTNAAQYVGSGQQLTIQKKDKSGIVFNNLLNKFRPKSYILKNKFLNYFFQDYSYTILNKLRININNTNYAPYKLNDIETVYDNFNLSKLSSTLSTRLYYMDSSSLITKNGYDIYSYSYPCYTNGQVKINDTKSIYNKHYYYNFYNILENGNPDNQNYSDFRIVGKFSEIDDMTSLEMEYKFIPTFDINDAYINESFFKTYGIITKSHFLDSNKNFLFKSDSLSVKNINFEDLSDFDFSIIFGRHLSFFKINIIDQKIYPPIVPYTSDISLSESDILSSGRLVYKTNPQKTDIIFVNNDVSGYNISHNEDLGFSKVRLLSTSFKMWLKHSNYLDFTKNPNYNWSVYIKNKLNYIGFNQSDLSISPYDDFDSLIVSDNLEIIKGSGFPVSVSIELDEYIYNFNNLDKDYMFAYVSRPTKGFINPKYDVPFNVANAENVHLYNNNKPIIDSINIKFLKKDKIIETNDFKNKVKDIWSSNNKKNTNLKYYLFYINDKGEKVYSMAKKPFYTTDKSSATKYDILIEENKSWSDPTISNKNGSWYQLYDSWEFKNDGLNVRSGQNNNNLNDLLNGYFPLNQININNNTNNQWGKTGNNIFYPIHYYFNNTFNKNQFYQFRIIVDNYTTSSKLMLITPWFDYYELKSIDVKLKSCNFYFYSKFSDIDDIKEFVNNAKSKINSIINYDYINDNMISGSIDDFKSTINPKNPITFLANTFFGQNGESLKNVLLTKSWFIQGFAMFNSFLNDGKTYIDINFDATSYGWHYVNSYDYENYEYFWYDSKNKNSNYPVGYTIDKKDLFKSKLDKSDNKYIKNNFICRYIKSNTFNLSFEYYNLFTDIKPSSSFSSSLIFKDNTEIGLKLYTGNTIPTDSTELIKLINNGDIKLISELKDSKKYEFLSLSGNCYLFFIAEPTTSKEIVLSVLKELQTVSTYHDSNNSILSIDNMEKNITYQSKVGVGDNYSKNSIIEYKILNSKIGNGSFESGIWHNGIWNNGWRTSENYNFLDIYNFYRLSDRWSFTIYGSTYSTSKFEIGDKVSITNIVSIDINNNRRLLKDYFQVIDKSDNKITFELFIDFPIRSIEKDSKDHLISISKNIWMYGTFLNGVFNGNWMNGKFYGYPFITKMNNSHWIDGEFNGGHFKSEIISFTASLVIPSMDSLDIYCKIKVDNNEGHNLLLGEKFDIKNYHIDYDSQLVDISVINIINDYEFNCNLLKNFGINNNIDNDIVQVVEIITKKKTGLIQNFNFIDNNISDKVISDIKTSPNLKSQFIFLYNSWMDLVYEKNTASNIFKPQTLIDLNDNFYSENNLYGYITTDVLSSNSLFRDSFSKKIREYKLGVKYKIFYDYIGDSSFFDDYLHSVYTPKKAIDLGWKWNISKPTIDGGTSSFIFYRSDEKNDKISGKELIISAEGDGGVLNIQNDNLYTITKIPNRYTESIKNLGYSMVSFDLIDVDSISNSGTYSKNLIENKSLGKIPTTNYINNSLNFSNINETILNLDGLTQSVPMLYLPVYENVNHLSTNSLNKVEYFFNKRDLMLKLTGQGKYGIDKIQLILDNLKFYELDMIPFFQYLKYENVNNSIQIPKGIDYKIYNYFEDNINIQKIQYRLLNISYINTLNYFIWINSEINNNFLSE